MQPCTQAVYCPNTSVWRIQIGERSEPTGRLNFNDAWKRAATLICTAVFRARKSALLARARAPILCAA